MKTYEKLESEKYLHPVLQKENKAFRKARSRKAMQDFVTFLLGVAALPVAMWLGKQVPVWTPMITNQLHNLGMFLKGLA